MVVEDREHYIHYRGMIANLLTYNFVIIANTKIVLYYW